MRKIKLFIATAITSTVLSMTALAGEWKQDTTGWWYINDDGSYPTNQWQEIDGKQYYFGTDGYMLVNTTTPDGQQVGADGALAQAPLFDFGTEKWHVKYTGHEVSSDYEGNPCVIVYFDYTNKASESKSAMASGAYLKAFQNGVQCDGAVISSLENNQSVKNEYKEVMPGVTINVADSFKISDMSAVTLILEDIFDWSQNSPTTTAVLNLN